MAENIDYISFYRQYIKGLRQVARGEEWQGHCPYPERHSDGLDSHASWYVNSKTGLFYCQACKVKGNIITFCKDKKISLPLKYKRKNECEPEAVFDYRDENGILLYQTCRYPSLPGQKKVCP